MPYTSRNRSRSIERSRREREQPRYETNRPTDGRRNYGRSRSRSRSRSRTPVRPVRSRRSRSRSRGSVSRSPVARSPVARRRGEYSMSRSRSRSRDGRDLGRERDNARWRERDNERGRDHDKGSKRRKRSESLSSVSSASSDRKRRKRRKEKEGKRGKSRERERREKKERKREKRERKDKKKHAASATPQWGKYGIISEVDIFAKAPEFQTWLVEERMINPEAISKDQKKKEFARFVEDFNTATLPHEKYYHMEAYEKRMSALRQGEFVPPPDDSYDPQADMKAISGAHKKKVVEHESYLNKDQLLELRRVQHERIEAGKMKLLGMDVKHNMGVRMDGTMFDG